MFYDRVKYIALASLLAVGLAGFGIGHWASASHGAKDDRKQPRYEGGSRMPARPLRAVAEEKEEEVALPYKGAKDEAKTNEASAGAPGRCREAVIRLPAGTFTKEVDAAPYGHGRLTWTYEEDRVVGLIEGSVMGFEFELATEAEYSLSRNGTIYGLITGVRLNHVRLPDGEGFAELKPFIGSIEPLINDVLIDLPFSYQFRVQGDRLIINNFRILLAGPNPLGKLGGLQWFLGDLQTELNELVSWNYFQTLGIALEGTYHSDDAKEKPHPKKRTTFPKSGGRVGTKTTK